jgi:TetR/AcrR family transcriptional regulator, cholesterol catabolism regulator
VTSAPSGTFARDHPGQSPRLDEILRAAERLFYQKGYEGTRIREVAEAVGMLKGSLYYHIGSKEELLLTIIERVHRDSLRNLEDRTRGYEDPEQALCAAMRAHVGYLIGNAVVVTIAHREFRCLAPASRARLQVYRDRYEEVFRSILEVGVRTGRLDERVHPVFVTRALLGMTNWLNTWFRPTGPLTADEAADRFTALLLDGTRAKPAPYSGPAAPTTDRLGR